MAEQHHTHRSTTSNEEEEHHSSQGAGPGFSNFGAGAGTGGSGFSQFGQAGGAPQLGAGDSFGSGAPGGATGVAGSEGTGGGFSSSGQPGGVQGTGGDSYGSGSGAPANEGAYGSGGTPAGAGETGTGYSTDPYQGSAGGAPGAGYNPSVPSDQTGSGGQLGQHSSTAGPGGVARGSSMGGADQGTTVVHTPLPGGSSGQTGGLASRIPGTQANKQRKAEQAAVHENRLAALGNSTAQHNASAANAGGPGSTAGTY